MNSECDSGDQSTKGEALSWIPRQDDRKLNRRNALPLRRRCVVGAELEKDILFPYE